MRALFIDFLNISITASYIILATLIIRGIFKKIPRKFICILWAIAGIRLVLPFNIESDFSLIPSAETIKPVSGRSYGVRINSGISAIDTPVNEYLGDRYYEGVTVTPNLKDIVTSVAAIVWVVGIAAILIYGIVSYIRLRKTVSTAVLLRDNIRQSENVVSPFILGIFKPKVYIPFGMDGETADYVIAHEKAHLKRRDHWIKPFGFLILAVYWFNPLIWVAYIMLCRDIERACDEKVIAKMDENSRKAYATALLDCAVNRRRIAACPLAFGEVGIKERIKGVMNYKKPAFWVILIAVVACVAVSVCFLTNPVKQWGVSDGDYSYTAYHLRVKVDTYYSSTQLPSKTDYNVVELEQGAVQTLFASTKFTIKTVDFQRDIIELEFNKPLVYNGEDITTLSVGLNEKESVSSSGGIYYDITFCFEERDRALRDAISDAITEHNQGRYPLGTYACNYYEITSTKTEDGAEKDDGIMTVTAYMLAAYGEYVYNNGIVEQVGGFSGPIALTFECRYGDNILTEYWEPENGSRYVDSIKEKFEHDAEKVIGSSNTEKVVDLCDQKAETYFANDYNGGYANTDCEGVSLNVLNIVTDGEKPYIEIEWVNDTGVMITYGQVFWLEKFNYENHSWEEAKLLEEQYFTTPSYAVDSHGTVTERYILSCYDLSQEGYYRFKTPFYSKLKVGECTATVDFVIGNAEEIISYTKPNIRVYLYRDSAEKMQPNFSLENGRFRFFYSPLDSYYWTGTYTLDDEKLVLTTDDGNRKLTFKVDGDKYIFDAENSFDLPAYKPATNEPAEKLVPDGAEFY